MFFLNLFHDTAKREKSYDKDNHRAKFLSEMAYMSFQESINREKSILEQAGKMQLAFSFVIMAVLTAYGFTRDLCYSEGFHKNCFTLTFVVSIMLIASLWLATMATYRFKYTRIGSVTKLKKYFDEEKDLLVTIAQQEHSKILYLEKAQKSIDINNDKRVSYLMFSINLFLLTLILFAAWAIYIIFTV